MTPTSAYEHQYHWFLELVRPAHEMTTSRFPATGGPTVFGSIEPVNRPVPGKHECSQHHDPAVGASG